jgi:hypothetical protein
MALLKNIHMLSDLDQKSVDLMEHAALQHKRYSNITFKIVEVAPKKVIIQAVQGKSAAGNYQTQKRLVEIVHETFDRFFPGKKIHVHAVPFKESMANRVDPDWIRGKMTATGIRLKDIASDTGIDYTQLSALITGVNPLSQPMKALFWYYFLSKEAVATRDN